jgi:LPS export ABC transporter protein LptC
MSYFSKKPNLLKLLLILAIVLTFGVVVGIFINYRNSSSSLQDSALTSIIDSNAKLALGKIQHTATRNGKKEWTLTAESAIMMDGKKKKTLITKPSIIFYLENGEKVYLTANRAILNIASNNMEAIGNVKVIHKEYVLYTQKLIYLHKVRKLLSRNPIKIEGSNFVLRSKSLVYDLNKKTSILQGRVKGLLYENIIL